MEYPKATRLTLFLFFEFNDAKNRDISKTPNFEMIMVIAVLFITKMGHHILFFTTARYCLVTENESRLLDLCNETTHLNQSKISDKCFASKGPLGVQLLI